MLVQGDEELLVRAMRALFETAVRFSAEGETVSLAQKALPDQSRSSSTVTANPFPATPCQDSSISSRSKKRSTPGRDLGLGPAVAYRILSLFGARVSVENRMRNPPDRLAPSVKQAFSCYVLVYT